ncbi:uncharacterized protein KY384_006047 [Bacidia gigantensis]|uniref:uncharacterized protein n=1 Tax=Bacidia gigantensis TaxID=2732470 RepID=UPI001D057914|nr:uncharacterized protein KY384_006047 [Bacidia gigantensis]KAG8529410.1 hypothetical protein KY384_006047 [Bacidia gigantensis]
MQQEKAAVQLDSLLWKIQKDLQKDLRSSSYFRVFLFHRYRELIGKELSCRPVPERAPVPGKPLLDKGNRWLAPVFIGRDAKDDAVMLSDGLVPLPPVGPRPEGMEPDRKPPDGLELLPYGAVTGKPPFVKGNPGWIGEACGEAVDGIPELVLKGKLLIGELLLGTLLFSLPPVP